MTLTPEDRYAAAYRHLQDQREAVRRRRWRRYWQVTAATLVAAALCIGVVSQVEHNASPLGQVALVAAVAVFCLAALAGLIAAGWSLFRQVLELIEDIRDGREARRRAAQRPTL